MNKLLVLFILAFSVSASEIKILSWYKTDRSNDNDSSAEVCFSLKPAPTKPVFAQITVDKGYRSEAFYSAWISSKASVCSLVSTLRGRVEVNIPSLKIDSKSLKTFKIME